MIGASGRDPPGGADGSQELLVAPFNLRTAASRERAEHRRTPRAPVRFGAYDVDIAGRELRKGGVRLHLQQQPFQVLAVLLARPGEVVPYEELIAELWPNEIHGEFVRNLRQSVRRLRATLGDSPTSPKWIETIPKVGYRFVGTLHSPSRRPATRRGPGYSTLATILAIGMAVILAALFATRYVEGSSPPDAELTETSTF